MCGVVPLRLVQLVVMGHRLQRSAVGTEDLEVAIGGSQEDGGYPELWARLAGLEAADLTL